MTAETGLRTGTEQINSIRNKILYLKDKVSETAIKAGRNPEEIKIVAVSKTMPVEVIRLAYESGMIEFGENKVQELIEKIPCMPEDINWHMIGRLQRNKVRQIVGKTVLIHSLDSIELADEIQKRSELISIITEVLIQVNVSGEESKAGISPDYLNDLLDYTAGLGNIKMRGLMTIAPVNASTSETRHIFAKLKKLHVDIKHKKIDNIDIDILSMGMSNDFESAILEGSTMLRLGTAIFGSRS